MVLVLLLSDGARYSPGRFARPSTWCVEEMLVVSWRRARGSESLVAVCGRAGKSKVGRTSRGREVIIIKCAPWLALARPGGASSRRCIEMPDAKTLLAISACVRRARGKQPEFSQDIWD
jgi:hypothetical protein